MDWGYVSLKCIVCPCLRAGVRNRGRGRGPTKLQDLDVHDRVWVGFSAFGECSAFQLFAFACRLKHKGHEAFNFDDSTGEWHEG